MRAGRNAYQLAGQLVVRRQREELGLLVVLAVVFGPGVAEGLCNPSGRYKAGLARTVNIS